MFAGHLRSPINTLVGQCPPFSIDSPARRTQCPELNDYFSLYGFGQLDGLFEQYSFGTLALSHFRIASHCWVPKDAKASVLVVHGLFDHVGLFLPFIQFLLENNYAVLAFDLPGHGLSSGAPGAIRDFGEYAAVISELLDSEEHSLPGPVYAVAQSTGAAAVMHYLFDRKPSLPLEAAVLLVPLVRPRQWYLVRLRYALVGWLVSKVPRRWGINSHDQAFCEFLREHDPLQASHISVLWVDAMLRYAKTFPKETQSDIPMLVIQASEDLTVDYRANWPMIQRAFPRAEHYLIEGAMHHLIREGDPWRALAYNKINDFFSEQRSELK